MFEKLNADEGITIILVTHDAGVARHARRIIHIRDGMIENGASSSDARRQPDGSRDPANRDQPPPAEASP
jgi:ABC-type lipoprotein export system ATPase subunit